MKADACCAATRGNVQARLLSHPPHRLLAQVAHREQHVPQRLPLHGGQEVRLVLVWVQTPQQIHPPCIPPASSNASCWLTRLEMADARNVTLWVASLQKSLDVHPVASLTTVGIMSSEGREANCLQACGASSSHLAL